MLLTELSLNLDILRYLCDLQGKVSRKQLDREVWGSSVGSGDGDRGLIICLYMVTKTLGITDSAYEKCISWEMG